MDPVAVVGTDFHYIVLYSSADSKDSKLALVHALSKKVPPPPLAAWWPHSLAAPTCTDPHPAYARNCACACRLFGKRTSTPTRSGAASRRRGG